MSGATFPSYLKTTNNLPNFSDFEAYIKDALGLVSVVITGTPQEAQLQRMFLGAVEWLEKSCSISIAVNTFEYVNIDTKTDCYLIVYNIQSISEVMFFNFCDTEGKLLEPSEFKLLIPNVFICCPFKLLCFDAIKITFVAGYATIPECVKLAIARIVAYMYQNGLTSCCEALNCLHKEVAALLKSTKPIIL